MTTQIEEIYKKREEYEGEYDVLLLLDKFFPFHLCGYITGGHSSVVEHPTADRIVPGSNPGAP